jgi:hypothetical protein
MGIATGIVMVDDDDPNTVVLALCRIGSDVYAKKKHAAANE